MGTPQRVAFYARRQSVSCDVVFNVNRGQLVFRKRYFVAVKLQTKPDSLNLCTVRLLRIGTGNQIIGKGPGGVGQWFW